MRLASFDAGDGMRFGAVVGSGLVDLGRRLGERFADLHALLRADALDEALRALDGASPDFDSGEVRFLPPIARPGKILCVGVNYVNRNAEYRDGSDLPAYPSIFMRTAGSLVGHGQPVVRPPESEQLDYEGEIAIVIGRAGRRIPEDEAHDHIAGLTCMNEGTVRDWLRHGKFNVTQGKNFERTGAIGPWIATADEIEDFEDLHVTTRVNGDVRQDDTIASLLFPFRYLIHYISTFTALAPGDVIATGTPSGAGARFEPPRFLVPGDVVEVHCPAVGTLRNEVIDEPLDQNA